ncbi:Ref family recombination enhancement nuclease [Thaumasiovibrio sp. DFM-14]|uniref:Ref family recombination enhancement nuclease n=1 Tax=Thaumasiovibrio sp. DFM-14 TaxID=3384792 RepID=UPI0039A36320
MALTDEERHQRKLTKAREVRERARRRKIERINSQEYKDKQLAKAKEQRQRQIDRVNSPEYRAKVKAKIEQARARRKTIKSKGLKGRSPTSEEQTIMDCIGRLPCTACAAAGRDSPVISLHHTDGRTKPNSHAKVLPLCAYHHDTPVDKATLALYPDLVPIHAKGSLGGKYQWEKLNGPIEQHLRHVHEQANHGFDLEVLFPDWFSMSLGSPA